MKVLTIKTDQETAEVGIAGGKQIKWKAHRELSGTIIEKIDKLCDVSSVEAIIVYKGPGSFTGLRIGHTVANAIAYSGSIPIVSSGGEDWIKKGLQKIEDGKTNNVVIPEYGGEANITKPKK